MDFRIPLPSPNVQLQRSSFEGTILCALNGKPKDNHHLGFPLKKQKHVNSLGEHAMQIVVPHELLSEQLQMKLKVCELTQEGSGECEHLGLASHDSLNI